MLSSSLLVSREEWEMTKAVAKMMVLAETEAERGLQPIEGKKGKAWRLDRFYGSTWEPNRFLDGSMQLAGGSRFQFFRTRTMHTPMYNKKFPLFFTFCAYVLLISIYDPNINMFKI